MPKIMFRCDSSNTTGTGHVTRCFALAEVFERLGWDVIFCGEFEEPKWILQLLTRIKNLKIESVEVVLNSQIQYDVVVFDSYDFASNEQNSLDNFGNFIVSIVDEVSEKINADLYVSSLPLQYLERFDKVSNYLFGPEYALIRSEFLEFNNSYFTLYPSSSSTLIIVLSVFPLSWFFKPFTFSNNTTLGAYPWLIFVEIISAILKNKVPLISP